jgi:general secretion pathway protein G
MDISNQKAFTLLELTFVIVIIGILSAIAIPRFAATRDDAVITKAIATVSSVRNAVATERQQRVLRGDFGLITDLAFTNGQDNPIFDFFDGNNTVGNEVLEYPLRACKDATARGCWISNADTTYTYRMPASTNDVDFTLGNNRFTCSTTGATGAECRLLTE